MELIAVCVGFVLVLGTIGGLVSVTQIGGLGRRLRALEARQPTAPPPVEPPPRVFLVEAPPRARFVAPPLAPALRATAPPPPPPPSDRATLEELIGLRWSTWVGAVAVLCAGCFYVQLAASRGWLGSTGKVTLALVAGVVAAVLGDRSLRRDARVLGQGLLGLGLGLMFGALHAGFARYHLYGATPAAVALIAVTVVGMVIAVRRDAAPIAVLAVLGGYLTPALASTGAGSRDVLCAYLTVLDLGVLGVALARRWRGLEGLAFVGTWLLVGAWYHRAAEPGALATLAWCAGFVVIFLAIPLGYHLRRRIALTHDRLALAVGAGAVGFGFARELLDGVAARLAVVAVALALVYLVVTALVRRRLAGDGFAYAVCAIVAAGFATLAVPLALCGHGLMLGWAIEAPVLLWLGARYRLARVRHAGFAVLALAAAMLFARHWPLHRGGFTPFANLALASALLVPAMAVGFALLARRIGRALGDGRDCAAAVAAAALAGGLTLVLIHAELWATWVQAGHAARAPIAVAVWWLAASGGLLAAARRGPVGVWLAALATTVVAALLALVVAALAPTPPALLNPRFAVLLATCALVVAVGRGGRRRDAGGVTGPLRTLIADAAPWLAGLGLGLVVSREVWQQVHLAVDDPARARWLAQTVLTATWSVAAVVTLAVGFARSSAAVRVAGLGLFGVTAAKVLLVDLGGVEQVYRVLSLLVLGVLLLGASWLYHRAAPRRAA